MTCRGAKSSALGAVILVGLAVAILLGFVRAASANEVFIPNFWDPRARIERPEFLTNRTIRFLTDVEFPPLHFAGPDGNPTGFTVELARAICEKLSLTCTVQARRFDTLLDALSEGRGDVVAAAVPVTAELRQRFGVTHPYFRIPARFAALKDKNVPGFNAATLAGRKVGVVADTAHDAYLSGLFPGAVRQAFPNLVQAQEALRRGEIDYLFADALSLALWIGGTASADCCTFVGGPFLESRYFGEGIGFVVRTEDETLRQAIDYALQRLWDEGKYQELYLRFFPFSPF